MEYDFGGWATRNDLLCADVARRRLRRKDKGPGDEVRVRIVLDAAIEVQNVQDVQKLALILVQPLDLDVKDRIRIDAHAVAVCDQRGKLLLILALNGGKTGKHLCVVIVFQQLLQLTRVALEAVADQVGQAVGQQRIGLAQPTAVRNAVGDVQEAIGRDLAIVAEDAVA